MKRIHLLSSVVFGLGASVLGVGCQDSFKNCENTATCPPPDGDGGDTSTGGGDGDGDGDTGGGDGDGDGDTGGTGGTGTGGGDGDGDNTGGMGGDPNDPCLLCEADEYCTSEKACVGCLNDNHCGDASVCDPSTWTCVGCIEQTDCEDPALPMCDGNVCGAGCTGPADCGRFVDTPVCDDASGECVGCLSPDDCGGDVCARTTHECVVGRVAGELSVCQACEYDDDCQVGQLCVAQEFDRTAVGNFCTWRKDGRPETVSASCFSAGKPYAAPALGATSVEGQTADLCVLRSTTCPAFGQHSQVIGCDTMGGNDACGAADLDDGLCRANLENDFLCTYPCLSDEDCSGNATCVGAPDGYCSL